MYKIITAGIESIMGPITLITGDERIDFKNGEELAGYSFDKKYKVKSIWAVDSVVEIELEELDRVVGNEEESFF